MAVRAIAADKEQIVNNETYVSSALAFKVQTYLPKINDGSAGSASVDQIIRVETTAGGAVELLTSDGRRVGICGPRSQVIVVARTGTVQAEPDGWNIEYMPQSPAVVTAAAPAGGVGAAAGAYDTAGNRDTMIALVNAMRTVLINAGLMKAE